MLPSSGNRPDGKTCSRLGFLLGTGSRAGWFALAVFLAGLSVTAFLARYEKSEAEQASAREFGFACREIQAKIEARLSDHAQILRSGAAFFSHDNGITRAEWHVFAERQKISRKLPGIQGFGFAKLVSRSQLTQHIQEIRSEGFSDYRIKPEGDRETYSAIIYLEPFADRNLRAFGYDMLSDPVRRAAMERARDLDEVALSGKVTLVQETGKDIQAGTLLYAPVYRSGMPSGTPAERCAALFGWVYSPYRMTDLLEGILGRWDSADQRIHLKIFDGATASPEALLFDSQPGADTKPTPGQLSWQTTLDSAGREWILSFSAAGGSDYRNASLVLGGGTIISLLLAGLVLSLASTRVSALIRERQLTADLALALDRLSLATKAGGVGVWDYDILHNQLAWDDQMFALYGITKESFGGSYEAWKAGVHPEDVQRGDQEIQMAISGEKDFDTEFRVARTDGSIRDIRALGILQRSPSGEPLRMIGTNWDITERKRMEEALLKSYEEFRAMFEMASIGMAQCDPQTGQWLRVNQKMCRITGYTAAELLEMHVPEITHPEDRQMDFEEFQRVVRGELPSYHLEKRYVRKDGTVAWVNVNMTVIRDAAGKPGRTMATIEDITERRKTEDALRESERTLNEAQRIAQIGSYVLEIASGTWVASSTLRDIFGIDSSYAMTTEGWSRLMAPGYEQKMLDYYCQILQKREKFDKECQIIRPRDGQTRWVSGQGELTFDADGTPLALKGTIQDITERKRTEEVLRSEIVRRQELEQEVMAAAEGEQRRIGHDLHDGICQELAGIQFVTELIARRLPAELPEKDLLSKTVQDIRKVILHARHLSHSLSPVVLEKGDLSTALAELAANTETTFGIACAFSCPTPPEISSPVTATHLYRIAQEAIQNAVRHGKATSIEITLLPSDTGWVLQVADNGTPTGHKKKSGHGLQIMDYRASMFGGSVIFQQNGGTTMTCTFSL